MHPSFHFGNIWLDKIVCLCQHELVMDSQSIKFWLKNRRLTREWLAERVFVSKNTVNGWLSSGKPISRQREHQIQNVMNEYDGIHSMEIQLRDGGDAGMSKDRVTLDINPETFDLWNRASKESGQLVKEWAIRSLTLLARQQLGL